MADDMPLPARFGRLAAPAAALALPLAPFRNMAMLRLGLAYLTVAWLLRGLTLGNPALHIDEEFYLLVGDRLLGGALPYVDIWDRKPVGLFVLFAAFRSLGGEGFVQYQVAALVSATATALTVNRIARWIAAPAGAWWAGVAYLLYLSAFNCFGGQSPVFYNLPMALAAWQLCRIVAVPAPTRLVARGALAMALVGLAMQIKYSVLYEGVVFGVILLARARTAGLTSRRLIVAAGLWIAVALAPTALAWGTYAWLGHGQAFFHANFLSVFARQEPQGNARWRVLEELAALIPFWLAIFAAHVSPANWKSEPAVAANPDPAVVMVVRCWGIAAVAGFLLFGTWFDHYVAPLLVPLAVLAAPALGGSAARFHTRLLIGFGILAAGFMTIHEITSHASRAQIARLTDLIQSHLAGGCLYLNEGDPVLYLTTHACLATRFVFPDHLAGMVDIASIGVDPGKEATRIMASHPGVVVIATTPTSRPINWRSRRVVLAALAHDYARYAEARAGNRQFVLFRLNSGLAARK